MVGIELTQRILDGDIGAIVCVSIPAALVMWWLIRIYIFPMFPARKWKTPSDPEERTYFYRKKKGAAEKKPPETMP
ncbi:MAG: hypothetical protein OXO50_13795 [Caldilineaceae bacterium]|nr:hypothetical protein [Caldilineaceae bacterium]MDE0196698.1 hypothetical protein [Caldilineaceae bacterium]